MKQTTTKIIAIMVFALLVVASQASADNFFNRLFGHGEKGSGDLVTQTRDVDKFDELSLSGSFDVRIRVGEEQSVRVTFDDNLIDYIQTEVRHGELRIYSDGSFSSRHDCRVEITVPSLTDVSLSGSGDIDVTNLSGGDFSLSISGSGDITAEGKVDQLSISVAGSGDVDARDLEAQDADVHISGSGDVTVFASRYLDARVSGSGDIDYYGDPEKISSHVAGSGSIRKRS